MALKGMRGTGTITENRTSKCPLTETKVLRVKERGRQDRVSDKVVVCKWHDNSVVCLASNAIPVLPAQNVLRYSQKDKTRISVPQPKLVHHYNVNMGVVDRSDQTFPYIELQLGVKNGIIH